LLFFFSLSTVNLSYIVCIYLCNASVSSDISHDIITILILQVHKTEVQWNVSLSSHCLNEVNLFFISKLDKFSIRGLDVNKAEIVWYIRSNFKGLWTCFWVEFTFIIPFILHFQQLVVNWYLSKRFIHLTSVTSSNCWFYIILKLKGWCVRNSSISNFFLCFSIGLEVISILLMLFFTMDLTIMDGSSLPNQRIWVHCWSSRIVSNTSQMWNTSIWNKNSSWSIITCLFK